MQAVLIVRRELTADASFAAIRARSKLGMAIAAMIKTGTNAKPVYPSTRPAMAIPRPVRRPALRRISDSDRWPMITATIADGRKKKRMPQIRLAIALPLVLGFPGGGV